MNRSGAAPMPRSVGAAGSLELGECEVLVCWALLDDPGLDRWEFLSAQERARASSLRFTRDRDRYVRARVVLRTLLGELLPIDPASAVLRQTPEGAHLPIGGVRFNVSHSEDVAAFAFTRGARVGVDVELPSPGSASVAVAFHPAEVSRLASCAGPSRDLEALRYWTAKEAYLKAHGIGLLRRLDTFEVRLPTSQRAGAIVDRHDHAAPRRWQVTELEAPRGAVATLVVERDEAAGATDYAVRTRRVSDPARPARAR